MISSGYGAWKGRLDGAGCPARLLATLQFLIVMIASAINDRLQRKLDYVEEERRILREQLDALSGGKKIFFIADQRRRLASAGRLLTLDERRKCCQLVRPATILAWFRQLAARKYDSADARRGRPPKPKDVRKLVVEMALANPGLLAKDEIVCEERGAGAEDGTQCAQDGLEDFDEHRSANRTTWGSVGESGRKLGVGSTLYLVFAADSCADAIKVAPTRSGKVLQRPARFSNAQKTASKELWSSPRRKDCAVLGNARNEACGLLPHAAVRRYSGQRWTIPRREAQESA